MDRTQLDDPTSKLLRACTNARRNGADFPSIWHEFLNKNPLVAGPPIQHIDQSGPILEIQLITGQRIVYGAQGFSIR